MTLNKLPIVGLSHIAHMYGKTPEETILYYARISNPKNQSKDNPKLLNYLIENEHWSPFEMISMCLDIETTRDIARQILRHRSFSFQEFSQRYSEVDLNWNRREARLQDKENRQSSHELDADLHEHRTLSQEWEWKQFDVIEVSERAYRWALEKGIAKEQARAILPEGLISTRLYMHGTIRSWIHYTNLRTKPETQKEHRAVALECQRILFEVCPSLNREY